MSINTAMHEFFARTGINYSKISYHITLCRDKIVFSYPNASAVLSSLLVMFQWRLVGLLPYSKIVS